MAPLEDRLEAVVATGVPGAVAVAVGPDGGVEGAAGIADLTQRADLVEGPLRGDCAHGYLPADNPILPDRLRAQMLDAVDSDWDETDRYGLGIGEITGLMGKKRSPCGAAWGHLGFSLGYVAVALSSEDGERQAVICANGNLVEPAGIEAFWDAVGRLAWDLYCA